MRTRDWVGAVVLCGLGAAFVACGSDSDTQGTGTTTTTTSTTTSTTTTSSTGGGSGQGGQGGDPTTGSGGAGGAGGQGTGGTGGGGGVPANDLCPGDAVTLGLGDTTDVKGSTANAADDYQSTLCPSADSTSGPDVVYAVTLSADGSFVASLKAPNGSTLNPTLYIRNGDAGACTDDNQTLACFDYSKTEEQVKGHFQAGTYYFIVDGKNGSSGDYEFSATLTAPMCGDGILNPNEQCDDGGTQPGDGCDANCKFEQAPVNKDQCPGELVSVTPGSMVLQGYTTGFADDYKGSCTMGMGGRDRVYQLVPTAAGTLTVSVGYEADGMTSTCAVDPNGLGCWDRVLYARTGTCGVGAEVACSDNIDDGNSPEQISFPVLPGNSYWVFVDGYDSQFYSFGNYNLHIALQ